MGVILGRGFDSPRLHQTNGEEGRGEDPPPLFPFSLSLPAGANIVPPLLYGATDERGPGSRARAVRADGGVRAGAGEAEVPRALSRPRGGAARDRLSSTGLHPRGDGGPAPYPGTNPPPARR